MVLLIRTVSVGDLDCSLFSSTCSEHGRHLGASCAVRNRQRCTAPFPPLPRGARGRERARSEIARFIALHNFGAMGAGARGRGSGGRDGAKAARARADVGQARR
jgi:hypothetical protein